MVTTIQLRENVKDELDRLKESGKETYEEVILNLVKTAEQCKRGQKAVLVDGYKEMAKESLSISKEWSAADKDWE